MKQRISNLREKAGRHKTLIQNFSFLSALQVFNLLLPLITYPYLIRVLGKETYGLVIYAQAIVGYLVILVGFGFNISATKEISIHRDNKEKLSEIVSSILIIKGFLFVLSAVLLVSLLLLIPQAKGYEVLFLLMLWMCLYDVIFPIWYFQGIEQMKYITYITVVSRLTFLILIFVFIHKPSDYLFIPIINGIGALLAGVTSLYIVFVKHRLRFVSQPIKNLKYYFTDSIPIFISNVSIRLYINTNKVIVGLFLGMAEVAYYDLAEKIVTLFKLPQSILTQTLFPKINKERNIKFIFKIIRLSFIIHLLFILIIYLFNKPIIMLLGGEEMLRANTVLVILAITIPIVGLSSILGTLILIPNNYTKQYSKSIVFTGLSFIIQIILLWVLNSITLNTVAIVNIFTELVGLSSMYYFCKQKRLL